MKIQTSASLEKLIIGSNKIDLEEQHKIELEFSAIDTGGGFKDPILDFSFSLKLSKFPHIDQGKERVVSATLKNPNQTDSAAAFSHRAIFSVSDDEVEINGRLKKNELNRDLIGFVLRLLR